MPRPEFTMTITLGQALQVITLLAALAAFGLRYEGRLSSAETRVEETALALEEERATRETEIAALVKSIDGLAKAIEAKSDWHVDQRVRVWNVVRELTDRVNSLGERLAAVVAILERVEALVDRMADRQAEIDRRVSRSAAQ